MAATRCQKCGFMQMATSRCKKCGAELSVSARPATRAAAASAASAVLGAEAGLEANPYAPPSTRPGSLEGGVESTEGLYRDGDVLVTTPGAPFPDRCVKCNAPTEGYRLKRVLYWHPPVWYFLVLISVLVYAIVAMVIRKKAELHLGLCERHRKRRNNFIWVGAGLPLLGLAGCLVGAQASDAAVAFGFVLLLIGVIFLFVANHLVSAKKIDDSYAHIKGIGPAFLDQLPPFDHHQNRFLA